MNRNFLVGASRQTALIIAAILLIAGLSVPALSREKDVLRYGVGLIVNIPAPPDEVAQAVEEVVQNTIIRGTKEYNKDEFIHGAVQKESTPVFPRWTEGGKVFYKVRLQALNPLNFKNSNDAGTLAVRYVVQPQGDANTVLRIDAVFVEDFRRTVHQSNGSVESAEYKDIQDRIQASELLKKETAEALEAKQEREAKKKFGTNDNTITNNNTTLLSTPSPSADAESKNESSSPSANPPVQESPLLETGVPLEQHVADLRHEVQRIVKQPGAALKSAPFRTASTLTSLDPGAEILILISTRYWYGVETHDGQHGWLRRDQLEEVR